MISPVELRDALAVSCARDLLARRPMARFAQLVRVMSHYDGLTADTNEALVGAIERARRSIEETLPAVRSDSQRERELLDRIEQADSASNSQRERELLAQPEMSRARVIHQFFTVFHSFSQRPAGQEGAIGG